MGKSWSSEWSLYLVECPKHFSVKGFFKKIKKYAGIPPLKLMLKIYAKWTKQYKTKETHEDSD